MQQNARRLERCGGSESVKMYNIPKTDTLIPYSPCQRRVSPPWYLRYPMPMIDMVNGNPMNQIWFCVPGFIEAGKTYLPYCGAPAHTRCRCGAQARGHDPGDEQS